MSNEAAGPWPTWDELFPPTPDPGTEPVPNRGDPGSMMGRLLRGDPNNWDNKNQRYPAPDYGPAPDPNMAPEGMVANPYYNLPGNAQYISADQAAQLADLNSFYTRDGGYRYDAYDATTLTKGNERYVEPPASGTDLWQRENDYYAALKARNDLSRMTAGNYQETGLEYVNGVGYVPWGEYVSGKYGPVSKQAFEDGPDAFRVAGLPQGVDTRVGNYYQPDGSVAYQGPKTPPALMRTNVQTPTGDVQGYEAADFFLGSVPKEFRQGGAMDPVQWALSNDVSRSQPRADAFGNKGFFGAPGGVVGPGDPAYDILRGIAPQQKGSPIDPQPFKGRPGTTTQFTAEAGDSPSMYPGVSFYEAGPDGSLQKIKDFVPGLQYYAVRENYDFGFVPNTTMQNASPGTSFRTTTGDQDTSLGAYSGFTVDRVYIDGKKFSEEEILAGDHGYPPGTIPAGSTVDVTKWGKEGPVDSNGLAKDANGNYVDPKNGMVWYNDGTSGGVWLDPEDHAAAAAGEVYWDPTNKVWTDPKTKQIWTEDKGWHEPTKATEPVKTTAEPTPNSNPVTTTPTTPQPTSPEDFTTQMKSYILSNLRPVTEGNQTWKPGGGGASKYPGYLGTEYEDIGGKGWVIPVAQSTKDGGYVADLFEFGKVYYKAEKLNKDGTVNWVEITKNTQFDPNVEYVLVITDDTINKKVKK